jgi:sortase (surface protein transpeptidase)
MLRLALPLLLSLIVLPPAGVPPAAAGQARCFAETGYCLEHAFFAYWETQGGVEILGLPVSPAVWDDSGRIVQYLERAILEWHPANPVAHQVLLARLGDARLGDRPERDAPANPCGAGCHQFEATGHTLRGVFARFWAARGGLAVFGYPLTEEFEEVSPTDGRTYRVQYFERNRFEYHPEHASTRYEVLLGRLGAEALRERPDLPARPLARVPDYPQREPGLPERLIIPSLGVDAPIRPVAVDGDGNMESPSSAWETTWYAPGVRPGDPGNAVIAGHVDFRGVGPAVFYHLRSLAAGKPVWVVDAAGSRYRFLVAEVAVYPLAEAPRERIFGLTAEANLNLITCAGDFDPISRSYDRRVVVYTRRDPAV